MNERVGVVIGVNPVDQRRLLLPDGSIVSIGASATDDEIALEFALDVVRRADPLDWCPGVCGDGPLKGETVYTVNRVGQRILSSFPSTSGRQEVEYEVVKLCVGESPAELRLV